MKCMSLSNSTLLVVYIYIYTEWPKKCIHSLLINIFGINLNEISMYTLKDISASQERLCHLLSKNYKSACAIC